MKEPQIVFRRARIRRPPKAWIVAWTLLAVSAARSGATCGELLFAEDFSSLAAWTVIDGGDTTGPAPTWTHLNPGDRSLPALDEPFAIVDSDFHGFGLMDERLISPVLDAAGLICLELAFDHDFRWYSGNLDERAEVKVRSAATGQQWIVLRTYTGGDASGFEVFDLSSYAAADLQVMFHYRNGNWEWWWAVDSVTVSGTPALIFADGFESGSAAAWSATVTP